MVACLFIMFEWIVDIIYGVVCYLDYFKDKVNF